MYFMADTNQIFLMRVNDYASNKYFKMVKFLESEPRSYTFYQTPAFGLNVFHARFTSLSYMKNSNAFATCVSSTAKNN